MWARMPGIWTKIQAIWARIQAIWARTQAIWARLQAIWARLQAIWARIQAIWARIQVIWVRTQGIWEEDPKTTKSFVRFLLSLCLSLLLTQCNCQNGGQTETSPRKPNVWNVTNLTRSFARFVRSLCLSLPSIMTIWPRGRKTRTFPGKRNVSSVRPCRTPEENTRSVTSGNNHRMRVTLARGTCRQTSSTQLLYKSLKWMTKFILRYVALVSRHVMQAARRDLL